MPCYSLDLIDICIAHIMESSTGMMYFISLATFYVGFLSEWSRASCDPQLVSYSSPKASGSNCRELCTYCTMPRATFLTYDPGNPVPWCHLCRRWGDWAHMRSRKRALALLASSTSIIACPRCR